MRQRFLKSIIDGYANLSLVWTYEEQYAIVVASTTDAPAIRQIPGEVGNVATAHEGTVAFGAL